MAAELLTDASRALDANANPYSGAKWFFYQSGTSTPQSVYTTAALSTTHSNPVEADAGGKFPPIYFDTSLQYRGVLKSADEVTTIYDIDPINASPLSQLGTSIGAASIGKSGGGTVQDYIATPQSERFTAGFGDVADYPKAGLHINKNATNHAHYGVLDSTAYNFTGATDPIIGNASYNDNTTTTGAVGFDHHHSFQSYPHINMTGGVVTTLSSFWSFLDVIAGTVSEGSGVKVNNPSGAGTITNLYGVKVEALTRGSNNNIGVYVAGASGASGNNYAFFSAGTDVKSYFGGYIELGRGTTQHAKIGYDPNLGHLVAQPRDSYDFKLVKNTLTSYVPYVRFGDATSDTDDARIGYSSSTGNLEIIPRSTFGTVVTSGNFHLGEAAARIGVGFTTSTTPDTQLHLKAVNDKSGVTMENTAGPNKWQMLPSEPGVANTGLSIQDALAGSNKVRLHIDTSGNTRPGTDNVFTLGTASFAWSYVHAYVLKNKALTVAALPAAATAGAGARAFVTDANATTFASVVAGGGANGVPVYSDGTNWRIG